MIQLRHYQKEVAPSVIKYIKTNRGKHPLVVLPTGSGKTFAMADLILEIRKLWNVKILVLSHVKEILEQNSDALSEYLDMPIAINSAMLGRREIGDVTVAGIQSVFRKPEAFKDFNLVIIDEAHLISAEKNTMYQKFFAGIGKHIHVGFTATPFRLGTGYIYGPEEDKVFDHAVVDWSSSEQFTQLIDEGYLSSLTTKRTKLELDTEGIKLIAGDFNEKQLSERFDRDVITNAAIKEIMAAGRERKKWLIFAIDIDHAEHIAEVLIRSGIPTAPIHSRMDKLGFCRDKTLEAYKDGKYRCVVNVNILTTGFDDPSVDLIAMLRPTNSPILHVQSLGRGSRVCKGKTNCLILDFAGNTDRLGPINNVLVKTSAKTDGDGEPITKTCPECNSILPPAVKVCPDCFYEFSFEHGLKVKSTDYEIIEDGRSQWVKVDKVEYDLHTNYGRPSSVKVSYHCGGKVINEYICVEHTGFAKHKADHWIKYRGGSPCLMSKDLINQAESIAVPSVILVAKKGKYYSIGDSKFDSI